MKRLMFVLFIISMSLFSCGKGSSEVVSLQGFRYGDTASAEYKTELEIVDAFNAKYPNIKIEWEYLAGEAYHQKLQSMAAAGSVPDLFTVYLGARSGYLTDRGLVMDLRPFLTDKIKAQFDQNIFAPQGPNGEIYILSQLFSLTHIMYANKKIMDELGLTFPKTQEELIAQGEIIRKAGYTPLAIGNKDDWVMNSMLLSPMIGRFGGKEWFDRAAIGDGASFSDTNFVNALNVIMTALNNKLFAPGILQLSYLQGYQEFVQGKAVYLLDASWKLTPIMQDMGADADNVELYVYPEVPGESLRGSSSAVYSDSLAMNASLSKEKADAAFKFIMFFVGQEGSDIRMKNGVVSTYKLDIKNYDVRPLTKKFVSFIDGLPTTYVIDAVMDAEGMGTLNPAIQAMMLGRKTPQQVADEYEAWVAKNDTHRVKK